MWEALGAARAPAARLRPPAGAREREAAEDLRSAATASPSRTTGRRASCPRRWSTTWRCSAGARATGASSSPSTSSWRSSTSATSTIRRPSSTSRSSCISTASTCAALPVDEFIERCRRWAAEDAPVQGRGRLRIAGVREARPARAGAGGDLVRGGGFVEFLFVPEFVVEDGVVREGDRCSDPEAALDPRRGPGAAWRAACSTAGLAEGRDLNSSERSTGASSARCRRPSEWRRSGAPSACRSSSRSRSSGRARTLERLDAAIRRLDGSGAAGAAL